jgi:hypothetical protein
MSPSDALARLIDALIPVAGPIAGFLAAWIVFELTEWRRREIQKQALRRALRAELETVEYLLSMMVAKFSAPDDSATAVREVRWLLTVGRERGRLLLEMPQELAERLLDRSDDEMAEVLRRIGWHQENRGVPILLPTVEAALTSPVAGLSGGEIKALFWLKWQAHLLQDTAQTMKEALDHTFTIEDDVNHALMVENHEAAKRWYRKRAEIMLDAVRGALAEWSE